MGLWDKADETASPLLRRWFSGDAVRVISHGGDVWHDGHTASWDCGTRRMRWRGHCLRRWCSGDAVRLISHGGDVWRDRLTVVGGGEVCMVHWRHGGGEDGGGRRL